MSFDVFETVLVRKRATAKGTAFSVARGLARAGLIRDDRTTLIAWIKDRIRVDSDLWHRGRGIYTLRAIYERLSPSYGWNEVKSREAERIEIETEAALCVSVPAAVVEIERARRAGNRVVYLSDMYLSGATIRHFLEIQGLWSDGDEVLSSADTGETKAHGTAFRRLKTERPGPWLFHAGNDLRGDVLMARRAGVTAIPLTVGNLTEREKRTLICLERNGLSELGERLIGYSRVVRLRGGCVEAARVGVLTAVSCPILTLFALWLRTQSREAGLAHMLFLSRDGYVPRKFYEAVGGTRSIYVYASRAAWHPGTLDRSESNPSDWLFGEADSLTLDRLRLRLEMQQGEFSDLLAAIGLNGADIATPLRRDQAEAIRAALENPGPAKDRLANHARIKRALVQKYLEQQGIQLGRAALVDLGWNGRLQRSLSAMYDEGPKIGLYFGLNKTARGSCRPLTMRAFGFNEARVETSRATLGLQDAVVQIMETFCLAPHGTVRGYRQSEEGTVLPIFGSGGATDQVHDCSKELLGVYEEYGHELSQEPIAEDDAPRLAVAAAEILSDFSRNPTSEEAEAWGSVPFEFDQAADTISELGAPLPAFGHLSVLNTALRGCLPYRGAYVWRAASRKRTPKWRLFTYAGIASPVRVWRKLTT